MSKSLILCMPNGVYSYMWIIGAEGPNPIQLPSTNVAVPRESVIYPAQGEPSQKASQCKGMFVLLACIADALVLEIWPKRAI